MPVTMSEAEFQIWESVQPIRFELADGRPKRLTDAEQASSRLTRTGQIAKRVFGDTARARTWMATIQAVLGGVEPNAIVARSEEDCQIILRTLVAKGRSREVADG